MSKIKNISKVLEFFSNNYKDEYAIATSLIMYVDTSKKEAIEKEIIKRLNIFKNEDDNIDNKLKETFEILEDIKGNLSLKYGENDQILYNEDKFLLNYKFLSDFCKGASMINSIYSKEYIDMSSKGKRYKTKLSQLLIKINNNLNEDIIEKKNRNLDGIVKSETDYITTTNSHETNNGTKLLNYHKTIKRDREEYKEKMELIEQNIKKEKERKEKAVKIAIKKNKIIGQSIGFFILYNHTIYEIKNEEYKYLANKIKEKFQTDYNENITDNIIKIEDIAVSICEKNHLKLPSEKKSWGEKNDGSDGINYEEKDIIRAVAKFKIRLDKELSKDALVKEMREINLYLIYGLDSVKVREIVEEILDNKQKKERVKNPIKVEKIHEERIDEGIFSKVKNIFKFKK